MKPVFTDLIGNERLRDRIAGSILSERLGHAYILEGAPGSGRHTIARDLIAAASCLHRREDGYPLPCRACPSCKKIFAGESPDVITVSRGEKATLGVDAIRTIHADVWIAPNDLEQKVYLIEDAQTMTVQAQNAFLLILEEPPPYVRFLLLSDGSAPLLETVRSRAQTYRTEPLSAAQLADALIRTEPAAKPLRNSSPQEFDELVCAANGSLGQAKALLDPKLRKPILEIRQTARTLAQALCSARNSTAAFSLLSEFGPKREDAVARLTAALLCIRDLLLLKQTEQAPLCFYRDRDEATGIAYRFTAPELIRVAGQIDLAIDALRRNANLRLTMIRFAIGTGLLRSADAGDASGIG